MNEIYRLKIRTSQEARGRRRPLTVYIWDKVSDLRKAAKEASKRLGDDGRGFSNVGGVCFWTDEIHLWRKMIGAGYWAHELEHFMIFYSAETEKTPLDYAAAERMAWCAGDLTHQFWTQYYANNP